MNLQTNPPAIVSYATEQEAHFIWKSSTQKTNEEILTDFLQDNILFLKSEKKRISEKYFILQGV